MHLAEVIWWGKELASGAVAIAAVPAQALPFIATFQEHPQKSAAMRELLMRREGKTQEPPIQVKMPWSNQPRETLELANDGLVLTRAGVLDFVRRQR